MGGGGGASRRAQAGPCGSAACSVLGVSYADPGVVVAAAARAWWVPVGRAAHRSSAAAKSPTPTAPAAVPRPGFGRVRGWNVQVGRIIDRIGDRSPALAPPARDSPAPPNYTEPRRMQRPPARQPDGLWLLRRRRRRRRRQRRERERRVPAYPMPSKATTSRCRAGASRADRRRHPGG
jgi:hypothetical protein